MSWRWRCKRGWGVQVQVVVELLEEEEEVEAEVHDLLDLPLRPNADVGPAVVIVPHHLPPATPHLLVPRLPHPHRLLSEMKNF